MRRVSAARLRPGMVLGRAVYDTTGRVVLASGATLTQEALGTLAVYQVGEVVVYDRRVVDVAVQPLVPPEIEAATAQALRQLIMENRGSRKVDPELIKEAEVAIYTMARECFPEVVGEANVNGFLSLEAYRYGQPARVAGLSMLLAKRAGYDTRAMSQLGLAALMMNIGVVPAPAPNLGTPHALDQRVVQAASQHAAWGAEMLALHPQFWPEVIRGVGEHHERWDGTGYPNHLRGEAISLFARIIGMADTYYELVSLGPDRPAFLPHEAVEYVLAYSGELFDPKMVAMFVRLVPLYPTGTSVRLNTGDVGIVANSNPGHLGRPKVRICQASGLPLARPYDLDLTDADNQKLLVVEVDPFLPVPED